MKTSLKDCPSVHQVLLELNGDKLLHIDYIKYIINSELTKIRANIRKGELSKTKGELLSHIASQVLLQSAPKLVNIINGTGIVLHTGFGRAPFRGKQLKDLADRLDGYVNLEFDLESGNRGDRQTLIHEQLSSMCGAEAGMVVNNNAAAVFLALNEMAEGGEVICSRGQMVEIGGSFRIPDIIEKSGAILKEVGTTNRTHLKDYEKSISNKTKLILWVHTSNYVVKGFTKEVSLSDLVNFGKKHKIPVMADLGSGALLDMNLLGLADEIPVKSIVNSGPDIISFSGDKLLGGPQSGLMVGRKKWVNACKKNPLYRVLRCDKVTIGLLEETLRSYRSQSFSKDNLSLTMLTTSRKVLKIRGKKVLDSLQKKIIKDLGISLMDSEVEAGSGSLPDDKIESASLSFSPKNGKVKDLAKAFRCGSIPVVGYIQKNTFYIDLKAVLPNQIKRLSTSIQEI
jgi:L-seryl-tRNA(Ser) seleniumtransferase